MPPAIQALARIQVCDCERLSVSGGRLLYRELRGLPVHAASFIRDRKIVLETRLLDHPRELRLILTHELFHFLWPRLGSPKRGQFRALIEAELAARARGEIGESAAVKKTAALTSQAAFQEYVCEAFCDTAAFLYSGVKAWPYFALAKRHREKRRTWFLRTLN